MSYQRNSQSSDNLIELSEDTLLLEKYATKDEAEIFEHKGPPDGGLLAWSIVFASFFIHVVGVGIPTSIGVFQEEYIDNLDSFEGINILELFLSFHYFIHFSLATL